MTRIFISYRRDDAKWQARPVYEAFRKVLASDEVFMDIDTIKPGDPFREILKSAVAKCEVLLALIGPRWIDVTDPSTGGRRLDNPDDFVRIEIREALARNIRVIPVLLDGADMPNVALLPDDLRELADRQAEFLDYRSFDADIARLIKRLELDSSSVAITHSAISPSARPRPKPVIRYKPHVGPNRLHFLRPHRECSRPTSGRIPRHQHTINRMEPINSGWPPERPFGQVLYNHGLSWNGRISVYSG